MDGRTAPCSTRSASPTAPPPSDFLTAELLATLASGTRVVVHDRGTERSLSPSPLTRANVAALVSIPLVDSGGLRAVLSIGAPRPRRWRENEIDVLRRTAERIFTALQRARAEESLRRSEARWRKIFETSPTGIVLCDARERLTQLNPAFLEFTGVNPALAAERTLQSFIHPDDLPQYLQRLDQLRAESIGWFELESRLVHAGGHSVWVHLHMTVLREDQEAFSLLVLLTRIDERKNAEATLLRAHEDLERRVQDRTVALAQRARQLSRLASELTRTEQRTRIQLSRVLHDHLQQLLASAKMSVAMLGQTHPDNQSAKRRAFECLDEAITTIRTMSVELAPPILHELGLAAGLEWLTDWMFEKHQLTVHLDADPDANPVSEDVRMLVFESVRELLFNTAKHAGIHEAWVTVRKVGERCQVTVRDQGLGFDPRTVLGPTDKRTNVGIGLFRIAERLSLLGGRLDIESSAGNGACFTLEVPMTDAPSGAQE